MHLSDLEKYPKITIQCHDNPDADTLSSGFALYTYFKSKQKDVRLIYSGYNKIKKKNIVMMRDFLHIPIEYVAPGDVKRVSGLLITVDCQYGSGNVTKIEADYIAVIDHHPQECFDADHYRIQTNLGSCATLAWSMLFEEGYPVQGDIDLGTALYYGLYMDTNQFAELFHPMDMDMREMLCYNKSIFMQFKHANLSLQELEIAGVAMIRYHYNERHHFALIKAQPCDPNILGLISDFLLQVEEIDSCVVYNELNEGFKISVRSCTKLVKANQLATFLTENIGSGGGKEDKAGGFISSKLYADKYHGMRSESYFLDRLDTYYESFSIMYIDEFMNDEETLMKYRHLPEVMCYFKTGELAETGQKLSLRSEVDTCDIVADPDGAVILEKDGYFHAFSGEQFKRVASETTEELPNSYFEKMNYLPTAKNLTEGGTKTLLDYFKPCMPRREFFVYVKELDKCVKIYQNRESSDYLQGMPGDYLYINPDKPDEFYVEGKTDFLAKFELMEGLFQCYE